MEWSQPIRGTQFVTTYGPGSIIETIRGPRLIPVVENSGIFADTSLHHYEILEPALSQVLPERGRIFRLPSNADKELEDSRWIYDTLPFPHWSLCPRHGILYNLKWGSRKGCPTCPAESKEKAWEKAREQAVSFVLACARGHLSEVPWVFLLHLGQNSQCRPGYIHWRGAGGPLKGVRLSCPDCGTTKSLADLYHQEHHCPGRFAERGRQAQPEPCPEAARISQRAASDLFIPKVLSALTLPRADSELHRALSNDAVLMGLRFIFENQENPGEAEWARILGGHLPPAVKALIERFPLPERNEAARTVLRQESAETVQQARDDEFRMLRQASREGLPRSDNFQMDARSTSVFPLGNNSLRVTPVSRLRMVLAQIGYQRLGGQTVDTALVRGGTHWYHGVELYGEGLFLELEGELQGHDSPAWQRWSDRYSDSGLTSDHPAMVWWHTLSHRLIRALAVDSGYSAASVRERLYLEGGRGGVLLYAVQPGGDGTLGGLIALVRRFDRVLNGALRHLDACSNDPLCADQLAGPGRMNGAACYACSLLSETACEMRNHSLDRHILIETIGGSR